MKLPGGKWIWIIGGGIVALVLMRPKKKALPPPPGEAIVGGVTYGKPVPGQDRERHAIDTAIDQWMADHPGESLPDHLRSEGLRLGLIF